MVIIETIYFEPLQYVYYKQFATSFCNFKMNVLKKIKKNMNYELAPIYNLQFNRKSKKLATSLCAFTSTPALKRLFITYCMPWR